MRSPSKVATHGTAGTNYDRVYYWTGGTENGRWREAIPNVYPEYKGIDALLADLKRMGFKAVKGLASIGAPEGSPS